MHAERQKTSIQNPPHAAPDPPLIQVLLATYNGEKFLREQIESILAQTYAPLSILARDDGSRDGTRAILADYAARLPGRFVLIEDATPTGSPMVNFDLLMQASTAAYVACSDQDDVWLPNKLELSIGALLKLEASRTQATPCLVFTDLSVVADDLSIISPSFWKSSGLVPKRVFRLNHLLTGNVVTGCTMVMNRPLVQLASRIPREAYMHDWWIAVLARIFGAVTYLDQPTMLYRQHASNVLGIGNAERTFGVPKWRRHAERRRLWEYSAHQAIALLRAHGPQLPPRHRRTVEAYVRCETSNNRVVRAYTFIRNRFFFGIPWVTLAVLWYLWDMKEGKRFNDPAQASVTKR